MSSTSTIDHAGPFDPEDLATLVLRSSEAPSGVPLLGSEIGEVPPHERHFEAEGRARSVFSSRHFDQVPPTPWGVFEPGMTYVVSLAYLFETDDGAREYLGDLRKTLVRPDESVYPDESQRGPDGSWLLFDAQYRHTATAPEIPVAVAAWPDHNVAFVVLYLGAESSVDALSLSRTLQVRVLASWEDQ